MKKKKIEKEIGLF